MLRFVCEAVNSLATDDQMRVRVIGVEVNAGDEAEFIDVDFLFNLAHSITNDFPECFDAFFMAVAELFKRLRLKGDYQMDDVLFFREPAFALAQDLVGLLETQPVSICGEKRPGFLLLEGFFFRVTFRFGHIAGDAGCAVGGAWGFGGYYGP